MFLDRGSRTQGESMGSSSRNELFISYCRKDEKWLDELLKHLKPYLRDGSFTAWSDQQIKPGSQWFGEIKAALARAKAAVLLVTPDFLASDFIHENELTPLLREAETGGVTILWIHVRDSAYKKSPLRNYQSLLDPIRPLARMRQERDQAWVRIGEEIEEILDPTPKRKEGRTETFSAVRNAAEMVSRASLVAELQRSIAELRPAESHFAPILVDVLNAEAGWEVAATCDLQWLKTGIQLTDEYLLRVADSAGFHEWQKDFPQAAAPVLTGIARSLTRSPHTQLLLVKLCNVIASQLGLRLLWPKETEEYNNLVNRIYRACIQATELESDDVRVSLRDLDVLGPG
jgi:hypothetical protein